MPDRDPHSLARDQALRILARRDHSVVELGRKLRVRGCSDPIIAEVTQWLLDESYLDDQRFAGAYMRYRSSQGFGPLRIGQELQQRGVDEAVVDVALQREPIDWIERVQHVFDKKFGHSASVEQPGVLARQQKFLRYRGFTTDQVRAVFSNNVE